MLKAHRTVGAGPMPCEKFTAAVAAKCPPFSLSSLPYLAPRLVELWASCRLAEPRMRAMGAAACEAELTAQLPAADAAAARALAEVAGPLHQWYADPAAFLRCAAHAVPPPTRAEFLRHAAPQSAEEQAAAEAAFARGARDLSDMTGLAGSKRKRERD